MNCYYPIDIQGPTTGPTFPGPIVVITPPILY